MIPRTVLPLIEERIALKPVVLITGPRQCGKTTVCLEIAKKHGFGYVSLAEPAHRRAANDDPEYFLSAHPAPVIIDEVQYAPVLFDSIEASVDRTRAEGREAEGMYILTGSQAYNLMEGVTQSMAGRVSIIEMSPLSLSEIHERKEIPFAVDPLLNNKRAAECPLTPEDVFSLIVRGSYPELHAKKELKSSTFYADYVSSYIERDVSQIINLKDRSKFEAFLELAASLTGQELVYETIAKAVGVSAVTVKSWMGVLQAGGIVHLLQPYYERSATKRIVRHPKLYFCDTGLACYLSKVFDPATLRAGYLAGPMVETFMVNEIIKSYRNNGEEAGFYFYRDSSNNEIDLVILRNGGLTLVECKAGMRFEARDAKSFDRLKGSVYRMEESCILCLCRDAYPVKEGVFALPVSSI